MHNRPKKPKNAVNNFVNKKQLDKPQNISVFKSSVQVEVGYLKNHKSKYKIVHQQNKSITSLHFLQIFMYCASKIIAGIVVDRKLVKESRKQIYHSEMM